MQARVTEEHKTNYIIKDGDKEMVATVRGTFFSDDEFPKVGDWVEYTDLSDEKAVIESILPRTSVVVRRSAHTGAPQTIVANVDVIFVVMGLDGDFNLSRLERYLLLAAQSEVDSVVVLNKCDQVEDVAEYVQQIKAVVGATPVFAISAKTGEGMEKLQEQIDVDTTVALLGSSGAGKSTITNWLLQSETQSVSGVRGDDSRGRHTTTSRQLFSLPSGGFIIDTPGMRELGLVGGTEEDDAEVFLKIEELSEQCKFRNCDHDKSQGCAVLEAIERGDVTERQLQNYLKLQRERAFEESKNDDDFEHQKRNKGKAFQKVYKKAMSQKRFKRG